MTQSPSVLFPVFIAGVSFPLANGRLWKGKTLGLL